MRKLTKKISALLLSMAILFTGNVTLAANYTRINGGTTSFTKYLVLSEDARVPDIEFSFTVTAGTAIPYSSGKMEVLAGVDSDKITISRAVFTEGENTASETGSNQVTLSRGEVYARKTVTVDFSNVQFDEPGIYRYRITEEAVSGRNDIAYDTQAITAGIKERYLDVYVTDVNGALTVDSYILHELASEVVTTDELGSLHDPAVLSDKSDGFVNRFLTQNLEFGKEVTGNQGSKDKYFDFTLTITGAQAGQTYAVDISAAEAVTLENSATIPANANKTNVSTITVDENGAATVHFYLKDGQYIRVKGLPKGSSYSLTEEPEDYLSTEGISANVASHNSVNHTDAVSGTVNDTDIHTGYTNTRNGVIPTGVMISAGPGLSLLSVGLTGLLLWKKGRKDEEKE